MLYYTGLLSFVISLALTPLVRRIAFSKDWMAYPVKDRWHEKPTALLGGIAIYLGAAIPLFLISDFSTILPHILRTSESLPLPSIATAIWIGMTLMFLLGLSDDFIHIKPHSKLVGQILIASLVTFLGFRLHWVTSLTLDTILTIIWIVGITNAFNLLDNMDGLCAGIGMICSLFLSVILYNIFPVASVVALIFAGAIGGFLLYNFNPASIFMGDCGSLPIGFVLSMLSLYYSEMSIGNALSSYAVPVLIVMVPILDTTMVTMVRLLSGRKASLGGKDHTSHRLVIMGLSEKGAVLFLYGIGFVSGIAALFVSRNDTLTSPSVIIPVLLSIILMGIYLAQIRVYPEKEFSFLRGKTFTPVLIELTYKRQLALVVLDFGLIAFAYYLSYRLRFESSIFPIYFKIFLRSLPAVIACKFAAFFTFGVYRLIWGFMSTNDVMVYVKASTMGTIMSVAALTFIYRFEDFSKGIFIIDWMLTTGALLGTRGFFRVTGDIMKRKTLEGETAVIYGAGRGGEILLREILNNNALKIKPCGFIDDDTLKTGKKLQGYSVLGTFSDLNAIKSKYEVRCLLVSFNNINPEKLNEIIHFCKDNHLILKKFDIHLKEIDLEE